MGMDKATTSFQPAFIFQRRASALIYLPSVIIISAKWVGHHAVWTGTYCTVSKRHQPDQRIKHSFNCLTN